MEFIENNVENCQYPNLINCRVNILFRNIIIALNFAILQLILANNIMDDTHFQRNVLTSFDQSQHGK